MVFYSSVIREVTNWKAVIAQLSSQTFHKELLPPPCNTKQKSVFMIKYGHCIFLIAEAISERYIEELESTVNLLTIEVLSTMNEVGYKEKSSVI